MTRSAIIELTCPECGSGLPGGGLCPICHVPAVEAVYSEDLSPTCGCGVLLKPLERLCRQCASRERAAAIESSATLQSDWLVAP